MVSRRMESPYVIAMRRINDLLNSVSMEIYNYFPTKGLIAIDARTQREISNDISATALKIRTEYAKEYSWNNPPPIPTREQILRRFSESPNQLVRDAAKNIIIDDIINRVSEDLRNYLQGFMSIDATTEEHISTTARNIRAEYTMSNPSIPNYWDVLRRFGGSPNQLVRDAAGDLLGVSFPPLQPTQERPQLPSVPRRVSPPSISQLKRQGFTNILGGRGADENTMLLFASKDPNLDMIGMTYSQLIDYAINNPGLMRVFSLDERDRPIREFKSSSSLEALLTSLLSHELSQLQREGFTNTIDIHVDENTTLRFVSNDLNLDMIGMTYSQLIEYAKNNPLSMRVFSVDERDRPRREIVPSSL